MGDACIAHTSPCRHAANKKITPSPSFGGPSMKKVLKYLVLILLAVLFIWTLWFLYQKSVTKPPEFKLDKPKTATIVKKTVANGSIEPRQEIDIKPVVSGVIRQLFVEAGQKVVEGDKLAIIQIVPDMLSLNQAEGRVNSAAIAVTNAQMNFDRNKPLADKGVIAASEMQTYDIALRNAKQEQDAAQDALQLVRDGISKNSKGASNTIVRSTINGMVLDVPVKVGTSVIERNNFNEGTTIATVADMKDLIFKGNVDESEVGKVRLGMPVVLTVGAIDSATWNADLEYIAPKGVEVNGAIQFEIRAAVKVKGRPDPARGLQCQRGHRAGPPRQCAEHTRERDLLQRQRRQRVRGREGCREVEEDIRENGPQRRREHRGSRGHFGHHHGEGAKIIAEEEKKPGME
jgi:HlyD family secretion protein